MFLRSFERNLIKRDFKEFLLSAETTDIEIHWSVPTNPEVDPVYNHVTADSWLDKVIECRASQKIIKSHDEEILRFGILKAGDCIFYIDKAVDLSVVPYDNNCYISSCDVDWVPVPRDREEFFNYLTFRLGNSQVAQPIPCRLRLGVAT